MDVLRVLASYSSTESALFDQYVNTQGFFFIYFFFFYEAIAHLLWFSNEWTAGVSVLINFIPSSTWQLFSAGSFDKSAVEHQQHIKWKTGKVTY